MDLPDLLNHTLSAVTVTLPPPTTPLPTSFTLPVIFSTVSTNTTSTPAVTPTAAATPQCASPSYPINALLQMQAQLESQKVSTPVGTPAPVELLRKISTASVPTEFMSGSLPASSPSTSSSKKEEEDEEEEEEEFVDIESVDVAVDGKEKRRAHVEFYRRMKCMRQQDKSLSCGLCKSKVDNQDNTIAAHVAEHADAGGYQCRLCGFQSTNKYKLYAHMRADHPRKVDMFSDKRDMPKMCLFLSQCFPKTTSRPKKESNRNADTYLTALLKGCAVDKTCEVCKMKVRKDKAAMIRHVQNQHTYKWVHIATVSESRGRSRRRESVGARDADGRRLYDCTMQKLVSNPSLLQNQWSKELFPDAKHAKSSWPESKSKWFTRKTRTKNSSPRCQCTTRRAPLQSTCCQD